MWISLRKHYAELITSCSQLLLLVVAIQSETREGGLICLGLMAPISLVAWVSASRRARIIRDTPTSRIVSAAQGYVELIGRGRSLEEAPLLSKHSALPCLWYRYRVERRNHENKWVTEDKGESDQSFWIDDGSGRCMVHPYGAEILTCHKETWQRGDYRYTEWKLLDIDTLYVIGQFRTLGGGSAQVSLEEEVKALLAEWKLDRQNLHRRFDLDGNGVLDIREWELARQAARREARLGVAEARTAPDVNYLMLPEDGRLFLISNLSQEALARRYSFWAWGHLAIFFGALGGVGWLLGT